MWKTLLKWLLNLVDLSVALIGDNLTISISLAGKEIVRWDIDILKDGLPSESGLMKATVKAKAVRS